MGTRVAAVGGQSLWTADFVTKAGQSQAWLVKEVLIKTFHSSAALPIAAEIGVYVVSATGAAKCEKLGAVVAELQPG